MRPPHCKTGANEHAKACVKTGPGNSILFKLDAGPHAAPHVGRRTCENPPRKFISMLNSCFKEHVRTCALFIHSLLPSCGMPHKINTDRTTLPIIGKTKFALVELERHKWRALRHPFCVYHFRVQRQAKGKGKREHVIFSRYSRILALRRLHFKTRAHTQTQRILLATHWRRTHAHTYRNQHSQKIHNTKTNVGLFIVHICFPFSGPCVRAWAGVYFKTVWR